jgi:gliding motility-associated-like protein
MNYKKLLFFTFFSIIFLLLFGNKEAFSQAVNQKETFEDVYQHWFFAVDKFRANERLNSNDFGTFSRFSEKKLDSLRGDFMRKIGKDEVTLANVKDYEGVLVKAINTIYERFEIIKQAYPSSVAELKPATNPFLLQTCNSSCNNMDFETGTLSGWYAYYGYRYSQTSDSVDDITGGLAGAVTEAANDTLTSTSGFYNTGVGTNPRPDYQVTITSGSRGDRLVPSIPVVSPFGGSYSAMLGDSTLPNFGSAMLSQTFQVEAANANFTYDYAVFLENPTCCPAHTYYQQPFFKVTLYDQAGDTIPYCGDYFVVSQGGIPGFKAIYYPHSEDSVYYKNWTQINVPLKNYIGQCVTVVYQVGDCSLGGHFGYAYVSASCSPLTIIPSSYNFCGSEDSISLTGPVGEAAYKWIGPTNGIISNDTLQNINIDSAGTYTLFITPFTGAMCNDTLTITIGKNSGGQPPHPDFNADSVCIGMATPFFNTSTPISGATFYWDFYNDGLYEDSTTNATWTYNQPGTYQIKLQEFYNGCGADTIIKVVVDSTVNTSFSADTVCFLDTTQFINTSKGGIGYYWNFGDPASGLKDTSFNISPKHYFNSPGTYTVTLIGNHSACGNDTAKETIVVLPLPKPTITGTGGDSICYGGSTVLTVGGGVSYLWSTGATTTSITVSPTSSTIYGVTVSNGKCSKYTTYTVYLKPKIAGTITAASVCLNATVHLTATGGGTYLWSTGATTSSISVLATSKNDTAYSVIINNSGGSCLILDTSITIYPLPVDSICCTDTIYAGNSVTLYASGGGYGYYWVPSTGLSCDTCPDPVASPTSTTTYTLVTTSSNGCTSTGSLTVDIDLPCKDFFVPNVFSPNGDGINDTYLIKAEFMSYYEIWIYNRWGKLVFNSTNPADPWDGNINGKNAAAGVYYYILKATCIDGQYFKKDGYLQLIRDN